MDSVSEPLNALLKKQTKTHTILVVMKNRFTSIAAQKYVVHGAGKVNSEFTCHRRILAQLSK